MQGDNGHKRLALAQLINAQKPAIFDWPRLGTLPHPIGATPALRAGLRWSGEKVYSQFPGAASYLPLIYAPQAIAIAIGELLHATVEDSVLAARVANGATAGMIVFLCLAYAPYGRNLLLLLLLLPESLSQFASNSADPMLLAITLAVVVFVARSMNGGVILKGRHFVMMSLCLLVLIGAHPPMLAIALLPLWAAWRCRDRGALILLSASVLVALLWFFVVHPQIIDPRCGPTGTLMSKGLAFLRVGPLLVARSVWWHPGYYFEGFVGYLGWGNAPIMSLVGGALPEWLYWCALMMLFLAAFLDIGAAQVGPSGYRWLSLAACFGSCLAIFFAMYAICTTPSALEITGMQGRYLIDPLLIAIPAVSGLVRRPRNIAWVGELYTAVLFIYCSASFAVLLSGGLRIYWIR